MSKAKDKATKVENKDNITNNTINDSEKKNDKRLFDKKKLLIIIACVVATIVVIYVGMSIFFMSHFYFKTTLNGADVSGYSANKVFDSWEAEVSNYSLNIVESDGTQSVLSGNDIGLQLQWDDSIANMIDKQNGFEWPAKLFTPDKLTSDAIVTFDETALRSTLSSMVFMDSAKQKMPVDATVSEYDSTNGFTLVESVPGTAIDESALYAAVENALYGLADTYTITEGNGYLEPEIKNDNEKLIANIDTMNKYASTVINYEVGSEKEVLDASIFADWISINDKQKIEIDADKVAEYVDEMATKYDTYGKAKTLATSYGTTVTVGNAHYGWQIDDEAEEAQIIADIESGETVTRDFVYEYKAASHSGNDYGNSYVEINLTAQHLFLYQNGSLVIESDFVSGNVSNGNATPTGVFGVTYTQKDAVLRGANYATPVSFWMPFNGNVGMHDATWRGSFGGSTYKRSGSHGCINLPYSAAQTIFGVVSAGYPVFVYELAGTETQKGVDQDSAAAVDAAIAAIGEVSEFSGEAIGVARASYDALTENQKAYVTKYQVLCDSEAVYNSIMGY